MMIYKATSKTTGKHYIGKYQHKKLSKRQGEHRRSAFNQNSQTHFHRALRQYGLDDFEWSVIDTAFDHVELNDKERYWVAFYDTFRDGYNMTLGGDGKWGYKHSEESIRKMSENRVITKENRIENARSQGVKPFLAFEIETGFFVGEFNVQKWCADELGIKYQSVIGFALSGKYHSAGGHVLIHKEKYTDELLEEKLKNARFAVTVIGEANPNAHVTAEQVKQIKLAMNDGLRCKEIQEKFGISRHMYFNIKGGHQWKDIKVPINPPPFVIKLTKDDVIEIKKILRDKTMNQRQIAKKYNVSNSLINNINKGKTWKGVVLDDELEHM